MRYPVSAILVLSQVSDVVALKSELWKLANKNINTS
jgi:hypothetical protein